MKKEDRKNIRKLLKEKQYDRIYKLYGTNTYLRVSPGSHVRKDIKSLMDDGRYFELYEKYGEDIYSKYEKRIMRADIRNEVGIKPGFINCVFFEKLKRNLKTVKTMAFTLGLIAAITPGLFIGLSEMVINDNEIIYESLIDEYDKEIEEYADYINSLGLTDLEIIVKVMNDMWFNIDGYKNPEEAYDSVGFNRLALYNDGYGVCRNMADDFTARINAINPNYEACNLSVYIADADFNNIQRTILETNETVESTDPKEIKEPLIDLSDFVGNHMVSCVKLKNEDVILIVDPTNPSIGVLENGKIKMLSNAVDGIDIKELGMSVLGIDGYLKYQRKILESFTMKSKFDEMNGKYGIEAQNDALNDIIEKYDEEHYNVRGK